MGQVFKAYEYKKLANVLMLRSSMDLIIFLVVAYADARLFCETTKMPLELGKWRYDLKQMDSAVVENRPVSIKEGQVYVYENYFPGYIIKYIHVDNLAVKTCGASATIKTGGVGTSTVLIVLHADSNQEIRSVVDIWGEKNNELPAKPTKRPLQSEELRNLKSLYLFKEFRTVNHNGGF